MRQIYGGFEVVAARGRQAEGQINAAERGLWIESIVAAIAVCLLAAAFFSLFVR
jgi:hypothetical protein